MNCPECRDLLNRRLDGEPVERAAAEAHLLTCAACRGQWDAAERLVRGMRLLKVANPPPDLAGLILAEAMREHGQRRRVGWLRVAVAASLLVSPWLGAQLLWRDNPPEIVQIVPPPPVGDPLQGMQSALAGLGERLIDVTRDQAQVMQAAVVPFEAPATPLTPVVEPPAQPGQGVSGLDIVGNGTRRAFAFFARDEARQR